MRERTMPGLSIRPEFPGCRGSWLPQNAGWPARPRTSAAAASSPASGRRAGSLLCALCRKHLAVKGLGEDQKESCKPRLFQFSGCSGFSPPATGPAVGCDARDRAGKGRGNHRLGWRQGTGSLGCPPKYQSWNPPDAVWAVSCKASLGSQRPTERKEAQVEAAVAKNAVVPVTLRVMPARLWAGPHSSLCLSFLIVRVRWKIIPVS